LAVPIPKTTTKTIPKLSTENLSTTTNNVCSEENEDIIKLIQDKDISIKKDEFDLSRITDADLKDD